MSFLHFLRRPETLNGFNLGEFWQGPRTLVLGVGVAPLNSSCPCLFLISGPRDCVFNQGGIINPRLPLLCKELWKLSFTPKFPELLGTILARYSKLLFSSRHVSLACCFLFCPWTFGPTADICFRPPCLDSNRIFYYKAWRLAPSRKPYCSANPYKPLIRSGEAPEP